MFGALSKISAGSSLTRCVAPHSGQRTAGGCAPTIDGRPSMEYPQLHVHRWIKCRTRFRIWLVPRALDMKPPMNAQATPASGAIGCRPRRLGSSSNQSKEPSNTKTPSTIGITVRDRGARSPGLSFTLVARRYTRAACTSVSPSNSGHCAYGLLMSEGMSAPVYFSSFVDACGSVTVVIVVAAACSSPRKSHNRCCRPHSGHCRISPVGAVWSGAATNGYPQSQTS